MPNSPLRVLHIDDDPALARLVEKALHKRGMSVENRPDAESGLQRIRESCVEAVILDHHLGAGTGLSVLRELKILPDAPPVVYLTGSSDATIAVEALKAGADDYVFKTVDEEFFIRLGNSIDQVLVKARLRREKERAELEVRAARDRAELLLAEVNHRVANSLALVGSLVRLQSAAVRDPTARDALAETESRIAAIANLHRRLYTSDDIRSVEMDSYLSTLIAELDHSMKQADRRLEIRVDIDRFSVGTDKAVSVGMIVTELLTNAFKYAYPGDRSGEVRVTARRFETGHVLLSVEDDGVGWTGKGKPQGTGLGTRIIEAMAHSLGSSIRYEDQPKGTRAHIDLPPH